MALKDVLKTLGSATVLTATLGFMANSGQAKTSTSSVGRLDVKESSGKTVVGNCCPVPGGGRGVMDQRRDSEGNPIGAPFCNPNLYCYTANPAPQTVAKVDPEKRYDRLRQLSSHSAGRSRV